MAAMRGGTVAEKSTVSPAIPRRPGAAMTPPVIESCQSPGVFQEPLAAELQRACPAKVTVAVLVIVPLVACTVADPVA